LRQASAIWWSANILTFYRVGEDAIEILRLLHRRRNIEADDLSS